MPHTIFCNAWIFFSSLFSFLVTVYFLLYYTKFIVCCQNVYCIFRKCFWNLFGCILHKCSTYITNCSTRMSSKDACSPAFVDVELYFTVLGRRPRRSSCRWRTSVRVMCKCARALFHVCDLAELALAGCMRELAPDGRTRVVAPARSI